MTKHSAKQKDSSRLPGKMPRKNSPTLMRLGKWIYRLSGWQFSGELANEPKLILALAPHTSNWDFFIGVPIIFTFDVKLSAFMKREAFFWPFTRLLNYIGFVPINRQSAEGIVDAATNEFKQRDAFWLLLTPEGTRKNVNKWKSGFLRIAQQADVPIQLVSLDYPSKCCHFGPVIRASGDIDKDLVHCADFTGQFKGRNSVE